MLKQKFLSPERLKEVQDQLRGMLPADKLLIISPKETVKSSGIIIPNASDSSVMPKKGQILQMGDFSELYDNLKKFISHGQIVTYGLYAGKVLELDYLGIDDYVITTLSANEIVYIENLTKDDYEN